MTYLVTFAPDTEDAVSRVVADEDIHGVFVRTCTNMRNGEAVQIRKADYLDTGEDEEIVFERPKLTLIQGGRA